MEDYKQKYEQALKRCKEEFNFNNLAYSHEEIKQRLEYVFPELKEDEMIRKEIIQSIQDNMCVIHKDKCIAWLEKQGDYNKLIEEIKERKELLSKEKENATSTNDKLSLGGRISILEELLAFTKEKQCEQKSTNKVEPKFKVGDYIINKHGFIMQIDGIDGNMYIYQILYNDCRLTHDITKTDESCHLWTIQDAKDGDVLLSPSTPSGDKECPFIFKEIDENGIVRYHAALLQSKCFKIADGITNVMGYANAGYHTPATKEQRDLLFQKMKEAGYEWDAGKKKLKKIEQESKENAKVYDDNR